jgi:hypothetical protein
MWSSLSVFRRQPVLRCRPIHPAAVVLVAASLAPGCAAKITSPRTPENPAAAPTAAEPGAAGATAELQACRRELEEARAELARAHERLRDSQMETAAAEERFEALRLEMDRSLDEVLASKASLRGVNSRALAISRIAEVRVQMQGAGARSSPEVAARLRGADALLARADQALSDGNFGGAAYLADRAGEMVRQARTMAQVTARHGGETAGLIPIVPPRTIEVAVNANLRSGPDASRPRVGRASPGTKLKAVGRLGEWLEVETAGGETVWIHRGTVR